MVFAKLLQKNYLRNIFSDVPIYMGILGAKTSLTPRACALLAIPQIHH
jgi:hypothetical protein